MTSTVFCRVRARVRRPGSLRSPPQRLSAPLPLLSQNGGNPPHGHPGLSRHRAVRPRPLHRYLPRASPWQDLGRRAKLWPTLLLCCIVASDSVTWQLEPLERPKPIRRRAARERPASVSDRPTARSHGLHGEARSRGVSRRRDLAAFRVLLHQRIRTKPLIDLADTLMAFFSSRAGSRATLWCCGETAHLLRGAGSPQMSLVTLRYQPPPRRVLSRCLQGTAATRPGPRLSPGASPHGVLDLPPPAPRERIR